MNNRKRILLINPWIYDFAAYDMWIKPLGLLYIGAVLRKMGYDITLIDCLEGKEPPGKRSKEEIYGCAKFLKEKVQKPEELNHVPRNYSKYGISFDNFKSLLERTEKPDFIFVTSVMTYWYVGVIEAINILREYYPGSKIILGGKYAQICHEHACKNSGADVVLCSGSFDETITEVFDILKISSAPLHFESDDLSYPAYDLYDNLRYVSMLTSIGCPFKCTYCYTPLSSQGFEKRSVSSVVNEILYWNQKLNIRNFAFYDDALNYKAGERLLPVLEDLCRKNLNIFLHTPNAVNAKWIDQKQADLMYQAGFKTVRLGFETSHPERQKNTGGKISSVEFERGCSCLKKAGFSFDEIGAYVLSGTPGQKVQDLKDDIDYLLSLKIKPYLAEYSPIPGTVMFEEAQSASRFDLSKPLYQNNSSFPLQNDDFGFKELNGVKNYLRQRIKEILL